MQVVRAYKHRVRFTSKQEEMARQFAGCARLVYNSGLEQRKLGYDVTGKPMSYMRQTYGLREARVAKGFEFLGDAPAHVLQQALRDLDAAYKNFFKGRAGYPKPRRKGENDSFRYPDPDPKQIGVNDPARQRQVRLPKLGWVSVTSSWPCLGDALFEGALKSVTVSRAADGWYASFTCETEIPDLRAPAGAPVGLDMGVANSATTSEGDFHHLPTTMDREWEKLARLQRVVEFRVKGSKNRAKAKRKLARYHQRLARRKRDAIHKLTTNLAKQHALIGIEDLRVKNMTGSAKGTVEAPGVNVSRKSGMNRVILDQCWGEFRRQLTYKAEWYGTTLVVVPPHYTSQKCPECAHTAAGNRESQAVFRCQECGYHGHADVVGATNTLAKAIVAVQATSAARTGGTPASGDTRALGARVSNACAVMAGRPGREAERIATPQAA